MTSNKQLQDLLERVARGELDVDTARKTLADTFRARPFEDLGFARVDHHRAIRQGFPEVILGLGKTPAQIAAIAGEIVARGSTLLVTRASEAAFEAVRVVVPGATYYADASIIAFLSKMSPKVMERSSWPPPEHRTCRSPRKRV